MPMRMRKTGKANNWNPRGKPASHTGLTLAADKKGAYCDAAPILLK